jgi:aspartyl-tRNA(Asn)/glutamyl-tRNA(Gln) amidotransferase subunit A
VSQPSSAMYKKSAQMIHESFVKGELSAEAITAYYLKRIDTFDPQVGAFLSVFHERALEKARTVDLKRHKGQPLGQLAGIPVGIKDNIHVQGELTTCASKFLTNYKAVFDATVTNLIEKEDGIILGKLNLDEFAMGSSTENSALKKTCNPWDLACVPGGSSGGSAAAVAAGLCPIALGSETGGSVRHPASFCGCIGFKPTYGRVSRYGLVAFGSSLDQIGPLARHTEDIALMMSVIGQHDPHDATSLSDPQVPASDYLHPIAGLRLGIPWHLLETIKPEARAAFEEALAIYQSLGCTLVDVNLDIVEASVATYYILAAAEASTNLARFDGIRYGVRAPGAKTLEEVYTQSRTQGFGAEVKRRILLGTYVLSAGQQEAYYRTATKVRAKMIQAFDQVFETCDVIVTPTTVGPAFKKGAIKDPLDMYLEDIFTIPACLCKLPAMSHPVRFIQNMPYSLQLMGPRRQDTLICRLAHAYAQSQPTLAFPTLFDKEA